MMPLLQEMLLDWRTRCPSHAEMPRRVFPSPGARQAWPKPRIGGGGPLIYQNFRTRYWRPVFKTLGLPYVSLHSARHSFISVLQAQGVEVGLVAKLAGHANPSVTLGHYTQAVRGGGDAVERLQQAYSGPSAAAA
jgi:integrase